MKYFPHFYVCIIMTVSVLSINVLTSLFINCAVLLKRCFTGINTCLCERIGCAGEESVGLYKQISTVEHPQQLIAVNYNCVRSKDRVVPETKCCFFVCDAFYLISSVFSIHTLVLVTFILIIFIFDNCYGVVEMMNVNKGCSVSVM